MRKDNKEFRSRFLRWKNGELVYENGRALPAYEDGVEPLNKEVVIPFLYAIENPRNKNVDIANGRAKMFDDGSAPTIGPGVANTSGAPAEWFNGKWHSKQQIDDFAYNHFKHGDEVILNAYNTRFGTELYPTPADTISMWPRLYMALNRYLLGNLGGSKAGRDAILDAVSTGNKNKIIQSMYDYGMQGDTDRMRRVMQAYPPAYNIYKPKRLLERIKDFANNLLTK